MADTWRGARPAGILAAMQHSFFERAGDAFAPTDRARGPWGHDTLHGRVVAGLFGHCMEHQLGDPSLQFARLSVDLFRMPKMRPVQVAIEPVREGRRIRVLQAEMTSEGRSIARASAVQLRKGEAPPGQVWQPEPWDVPPPEETPPFTRHGEWTPIWETRPIGGGHFIGRGRKRMWIRETHAVVAGEDLLPFTRVAVCADIASPLAHSGDQGLHYVNADITLYLHRVPIGEWVGWEVRDHQADAGVAIGECRVYDQAGPIGTSSVCALANPRSSLGREAEA